MEFSEEQVKNCVKDYIAQAFYFNNPSFSLSDDTSFIENGILDSTGILELINFIQDQFKIKIGENEILPENLDSLEKIAQYVIKKQTAS